MTGYKLDFKVKNYHIYKINQKETELLQNLAITSSFGPIQTPSTRFFD
jgi:hypothetical protein